MNEKELIEELTRRGYVMQVPGEGYVITNKLERDLGKEEQKESILLSPHEIYAKFVKDSQIPFMAKSASGIKYQLAARSDYSVKYLLDIITNKKYDYAKLTDATRRYYQDTNIARVILTNFFKQGIIDQVMAEYEESKQIPNASSDEIMGPVIRTNKTSL